MKLFYTRNNYNVHLFASDNALVTEWSGILRKAGLQLHSSHHLSSSVFINKGILLLLNPDEAQIDPLKSLLINNPEHLQNVYVVSDHPAWQEFSADYAVHLLSCNTHPLEVVRLFNHTKKSTPTNYFARYASLFNF